MKRIDLVNALKAMGYKVSETETVKNGVLMEGIVIRDDERIAPVIYTHKIIECAERDGKSVADVVLDIINIYEENRHVEFNIEKLYDREFVLNHMYVGIQKQSDEELLKKNSELEGLELYLYIRLDAGENCGFVKMNEGMLSMMEVTIDELWDEAEQNTCDETELRSLSEVLGFPGDDEGMAPLYVLSNRSCIRGAAAIINKDILKQFAEKHGVKKLIVLPSSIHEVLILPDNGQFDLMEMNAMVTMVNVEQVLPEDQLIDRAYVMVV